MALAHHLLRRSRASAYFNFQLMVPILSAAQSHFPLPLPFAPTRTFSSHTPCLDRLGLGVVPAESAATQSTGVLNSGAEESLLPVDELISMLDWFHQLTGLPWWIFVSLPIFAICLVIHVTCGINALNYSSYKPEFVKLEFQWPWWIFISLKRYAICGINVLNHLSYKSLIFSVGIPRRK